MLVKDDYTTCHQNLKLAQLTFKEHQVLSLSKKGMSCQEISDELFVTVETIKTHRKNIIKKLGLFGKQEFRKFIIDLLNEEFNFQYNKSPQDHP